MAAMAAMVVVVSSSGMIGRSQCWRAPEPLLARTTMAITMRRVAVAAQQELMATVHLRLPAAAMMID